MIRSKVSTPETAVNSGYPPEGHSPPGEPPYTRGIHKEMYLNKRWTMLNMLDFPQLKKLIIDLNYY